MRHHLAALARIFLRLPSAEVAFRAGYALGIAEERMRWLGDEMTADEHAFATAALDQARAAAHDLLGSPPEAAGR